MITFNGESQLCFICLSYLFQCSLRLASLWSGWPQRASLTNCTPARVTCGPLEFSFGKSFHSVKSQNHNTCTRIFYVICAELSLLWLKISINVSRCQKQWTLRAERISIPIIQALSHLSSCSWCGGWCCSFLRCISISGGTDWRRVLQAIERGRQDESTRDCLSWNVSI